MRLLLSTTALLASLLVASAAAPVATNIANFPSVSVAYTNYLAEGIVTNGLTLGGVRNTQWPWFALNDGFSGDVFVPNFAGLTNVDYSGNFIGIYPDGTQIINLATWNPNTLNSDAFIIGATVTTTNYNTNPAGIFAAIGPGTFNDPTDGTFPSSHATTMGGRFVNFISRTNTIPPLNTGFSNGDRQTDFGIVASTAGTSGDYGTGIKGAGSGRSSWGVVGDSGAGTYQTVGVAGSARVGGSNTNAVGGLFQTTSETTSPSLQSSVVLIDNRTTDLPLITARTNNGTTTFLVAASGLTTANAGFASTATDAAVSIAAGGYTNALGKNAFVSADGTGMTYTVYNSAGTAVYTNAATVTHFDAVLQPNGKVLITAGSGISGRVWPW